MSHSIKLLRVATALALAVLLPGPAALAYDTELSDIAVREAYFLGQRNDDKTRSFFVPYTRNLPLPQKGPYISEIRLLTPLAQVVQVSSEKTFGYSAQQAQSDYHGRGDNLLLIVHIEFHPKPMVRSKPINPLAMPREKKVSPFDPRISGRISFRHEAKRGLDRPALYSRRSAIRRIRRNFRQRN